MDLFENLQIMKESESDKSIKTEGIKDIVSNIKNWFVQNKTNKQIRQIQAKINSNGGDMHAFFDELVPEQGKADTKAGELIRAINRISYRNYNDGDRFNEGYGLETCGPAACFLIKNGFDDLIKYAKNVMIMAMKLVMKIMIYLLMVLQIK